jgi:hypothetical protein
MEDMNEARRLYEERRKVKEQILENIEYKTLINEFYAAEITELVNLMTEACCSRKPFLRIAGEELPGETVREQFLSLNCDHIRYVMEALKDNHTRIVNTKQYLLTALYNAPLTMHHYYRGLVNYEGI